MRVNRRSTYSALVVLLPGAEQFTVTFAAPAESGRPSDGATTAFEARRSWQRIEVARAIGNGIEHQRP